jgi:hypothetical protein
MCTDLKTQDKLYMIQLYFHTAKSSSIINISDYYFFFEKALTVLRGPLASLNGLLYLHIETFGKTPWTGDQPNARPSTDTGQHNTETRGHTSMPEAGFEHAIPMFVWS